MGTLRMLNKRKKIGLGHILGARLMMTRRNARSRDEIGFWLRLPRAFRLHLPIDNKMYCCSFSSSFQVILMKTLVVLFPNANETLDNELVFTATAENFYNCFQYHLSYFTNFPTIQKWIQRRVHKNQSRTQKSKDFDGSVYSSYMNNN